MAHYALLDSNNRVLNVIVGNDENDPTQADWEVYYKEVFEVADCKRTSYNATIRTRFAQIDGTYDPELDAFFDPKPFDSWVKDAELVDWVAPVAKPTLEAGADAIWHEETLEWEILPPRK